MLSFAGCGFESHLCHQLKRFNMDCENINISGWVIFWGVIFWTVMGGLITVTILEFLDHFTWNT